MSNPTENLASSFMAMAQAVTELPSVKQELETTKHENESLLSRVAGLESRIMTLKQEIEDAHEAARKVEVERDHAERMFLEADDRLNAFRGLLSVFQANAGALIKAAEPTPEPQPEPVADPQPEPGPAIGDAFTDGQRGVGEPAATEDQSQTVASTTEPTAVPSTSTDATEHGVSVPSDPTQATESSSENVSSGSSVSNVQHESAAPSSAYAPDGTISPGESAADPTASSTAGDGHSPVNAEATPSADTQADASTPDDVGYHNEPEIKGSDWTEWDRWAGRMNTRYGVSGWPPRISSAAQ